MLSEKLKWEVLSEKSSTVFQQAGSVKSQSVTIKRSEVISNYPLFTSYSSLPISDFSLRSSHFLFIHSYLSLPTSYFLFTIFQCLFLNFHFLLPYFQLPTSHFPLHFLFLSACLLLQILSLPLLYSCFSLAISHLLLFTSHFSLF